MPLLEVKGIVKRYPGVVALGGVTLSLKSGEIVAIIGENGAGKSTLMKVLGGLVSPDEGEILYEGKPVKIDSVRKSSEMGIALIHQELNPLDNLDVAGNVFLGREPSRFGLIDRKKMRSDTQQLLERLALPIGVDTPMKSLSLAQRQLVEIAKALSQNAKILIMDEPTSSLTLTETDRLLSLAQELSDKGVCVIYISHRLAEVKHIADRVVALKDGKNAGGLAKSEITHEAMVRLMVGRDLERRAYAAQEESGTTRLEVKNLVTKRYPSKKVSFDVRSGEIFALAGLVGSGRSEVVQAIFGTDRAVSGDVSVDSRPLKLGNPRAAIEAGVGLVPEDRRAVGLLVEWSILNNTTLPTLDNWSKAGLINRAEERKVAEMQSKALGVKSPSVDVLAANLSGGNQQKVVVAKWLLSKPKVLILDEPTRGVDVGAKSEIYEIMRSLTREGVAVLMVSSDMEEVLGISDRIGVMHEGALSGILPRQDASEEAIMRLAVGRA